LGVTVFARIYEKVGEELQMKIILMSLQIIILSACSGDMGACVEAGSRRCVFETESSCTSHNYFPGDKAYTFYKGETCEERGLVDVGSF